MRGTDGKTRLPGADKPASPILVSVVIPFFNAERTLARCIKSLLALRADDFEVILVNNNSTDHSPQIAQAVAQSFPQRFVYSEEKNPGPVPARNRGACLARGEILAFIDADCLVAPEWLSELLKSFGKPKIGAVAGRIYGYGGNTVFDSFHALFTFRGPDVSRLFSRFTLIEGGFPTANLAVRKELYVRIGGFDLSLDIHFAEDYDLCARIYREGFNILYNPGVVVYHIHRNSMTGTWKQAYGFGTGHALLLRRHFKRRLIIEMPRYCYESEKIPLLAWVNLASADKKMAGMLVLALFWWPFAGLTVIFLFHLYFQIKGRLKKDQITAGVLQVWGIVFLLIYKSLAMTLGRMAGGLKHGILCV